MKLYLIVFFFVLAALQGCGQEVQNKGITMKVGPQPDGSILVPSNQLLRPAGVQVELPGRPVDLALMPDAKYLLVKNISGLDLIRLEDHTVIQTLPFRNAGASFTGLCVSPDGKNIYVTDSQNKIRVASFSENFVMEWQDPIILPAPAVGGMPFPGGLAFNSTGNNLFVTLSRNNTIGVIDIQKKSVSEIPAGVAPYDIILMNDSKAYVSNWGGRKPVEGEPVYSSSGTPMLVDPETGIAASGSVSVVDLSANKQIKDIQVGLHPSGMVLSGDKSTLYVACANSDTVYVIDTKTDEITFKIPVQGEGSSLFGSSPNDLALSPDGKTLYVANGTDNAICVINLGDPSSVKGYIPTAWYPGSVIIAPDGNTLYVANIKGTGSRNNRKDRNGFNSHDHLGSVSIIPVPGEKVLAEMTSTVKSNNTLASTNNTSAGKNEKVPVPVVSGQNSLFKHVVYIIKENRTYDQVFGDFKQADGDSSLVMFGRNVTPNQHLLAETYVLLDNFYCSGVLSADGHQWTDEAIVTDYLEKSFGGFTRSYPYDGDDPLAYASSGFIWDNVLRHNLTFRNYGEFVNAVIEPSDATWSDIYSDYLGKTGKISIRAKANLDQLQQYICPTYIGFPNTVSDQYRADEFIKELQEFEKKGNFPDFIIMLLPNNHTSGTKPGMPMPEAAVADNDLALGRIVEAISSSSFWKETCILVTEDDPQNGFDHVDGHRTVGMVISPYTKRGEVISTYYSQINMVRTIENILGLPPMNRMDMSAEAMTDCFTDKPDFTPYRAVPANIPLDRLNPSLTSLSGAARYWAEKSLEQDLDEVDRIDDDTFNRIIWHSVKGYDKPYPAITR